ncbi:histidine--tRNA ligase [bacterium]|nr:histidine--tRNA ligase [bacterium]
MLKIEPRIFKGTRDYLPEEMIKREEILETIKKVFQKFGFSPLETPAIEYLSVLAGKYGTEADKLLYKLNYKTGTKDETALRYDLTVPLSRVIAMNPELVKPFKRYQIQPVWRADTPQIKQGRFREFYQCDIDTIGTKSMLADAELISMINEIIAKLGFTDFLIKINNRKILTGIVKFIGLDESKTQDVCRSIDKLDKITLEQVKAEMLKNGIPQSSVEKLEPILLLGGENPELLAKISETLGNIEIAQQGISEIREIFSYLETFGVPQKNYKLDLALARGLDYYTGPIFETVLPKFSYIGSLSGGGRYDEMISLFSGSENPAVGTTIGLDRIIAAMKEVGIFQEAKTRTQALVTVFSEQTILASLEVVRILREAGINTELFFETGKLKKQFQFADKKEIPFVIVLGEDELANNKVTVKNLKESKQETIDLSELVSYLKK